MSSHLSQSTTYLPLQTSNQRGLSNTQQTNNLGSTLGSVTSQNTIEYNLGVDLNKWCEYVTGKHTTTYKTPTKTGKHTAKSAGSSRENHHPVKSQQQTRQHNTNQMVNMSFNGGTQVLRESQASSAQNQSRHFHTISATAAANIGNCFPKQQQEQQQQQLSSSVLSEIPESPKRLSVTPQENHPQNSKPQYHVSSSLRASTVASRSKSNGKERKRSVGGQNNNTQNNNQTFNATGGFSDHLQQNASNSALNAGSPGKFIILSPPQRQQINFEIVNNGPQHRQVVDQIETRLSSHDDHLKSAMNALNEKLKFYENVELEKTHVTEQLGYSDKGREELRNALMEAAEKVKEEQDKNFKYQEILINENQSLSKQINTSPIYNQTFCISKFITHFPQIFPYSLLYVSRSQQSPTCSPKKQKSLTTSSNPSQHATKT